MVTTENIQFVGLRIGWLLPEDDAIAKKGTISEDYLRAMFLSKRDCVEAFTRAIEVDASYLLAYAISRNDGGTIIGASSVEVRTEDFAPDAGTIDNPVATARDANGNLYILDGDG